jgi:hypothetical protein
MMASKGGAKKSPQVCLLAVDRAVVEFRDLFAPEADVLELSFFDHFVLNAFRTLPLLCFDLVVRRPFERLPTAVRQGIRHFDKIPLCIIAKDKSDAFIPAVKVVRERKIGVAPEPRFSENRLDLVDFQSSLASLCSYEIPLSP